MHFSKYSIQIGSAILLNRNFIVFIFAGIVFIRGSLPTAEKTAITFFKRNEKSLSSIPNIRVLNRLSVIRFSSRQSQS